jgi:hypothetical protein
MSCAQLQMLFTGMHGYWRVVGFVDPNNVSERVYARGRASKELNDVINRNETLCLFTTEGPTASYVHCGVYSITTNGRFWVRQNQITSEITLKTSDEVRLPGSYTLMHESTAGSLYWRCCRTDDVAKHAIHWRRPAANTQMPTIERPVFKVTPSLHNNNPTFSRKKCCCGIIECSDWIKAAGGNARFVQVVALPTSSSSSSSTTSSGVVNLSRNKKRDALLAARVKVQRGSFQLALGTSTDAALACTHHIHPHARLQLGTGRPAKTIKTLVFSLQELEQAVSDSDRRNYFSLVDDGATSTVGRYIPTFSYSLFGATIASPEPASTATPRGAARRRRGGGGGGGGKGGGGGVAARSVSSSFEREKRRRDALIPRAVQCVTEDLRRKFDQSSAAFISDVIESECPSKRAAYGEGDLKIQLAAARERIRELIVSAAETTTALQRKLQHLQTRLDQPNGGGGGGGENGGGRGGGENGAGLNNPDRQRRLFTDAFLHQGGGVDVQENWYGIPGDFSNMADLFCILHSDSNLTATHSNDVKTNRLTAFEQCLLAKAFLHTRHTQAYLASQANCSKFMVRNAIKHWAPKWREVAERFGRLTWLGDYPEIFEQMQAKDEPDEEGAAFNFVFVNLDGKVFPCQQSRLSGVMKRSFFSHKTGTAGLQTLVWSMSCGLPVLVTGLFAAKLSEKAQVALHSGWLVALPPGVAVLEDRGFRNLQRFYPNRNRPVIPAACDWGEWHQLDAQEYTCSAAQARRRWPAEAIFQRVLQCPSLSGVIPFWFLRWVDTAHSVAYFDILLKDFHLTPRGWDACKVAMGVAGVGITALEVVQLYK